MPNDIPSSVPMIGPDGTSALVPQEHVQTMLQAGAKVGFHMLGPDGSHAVVPAERLHDMLSAGAKIYQAPPSAKAQAVASGEPFVSSHMAPLQFRKQMSPAQKAAEAQMVGAIASPENLSNTMIPGTGTVGAGVKQYAQADSYADPNAARLEAGTKVIGGAMDIAAPALTSAFLAAPGAMSTGLLGGMAAGKAAQLGTKAAGGSEQAQDFADTIGQFAGSAWGLLHSFRSTSAAAPGESTVHEAPVEPVKTLNAIAAKNPTPNTDALLAALRARSQAVIKTDTPEALATARASMKARQQQATADSNPTPAQIAKARLNAALAARRPIPIDPDYTTTKISRQTAAQAPAASETAQTTQQAAPTPQIEPQREAAPSVAQVEQPKTAAPSKPAESKPASPADPIATQDRIFDLQQKIKSYQSDLKSTKRPLSPVEADWRNREIDRHQREISALVLGKTPEQAATEAAKEPAAKGTGPTPAKPAPPTLTPPAAPQSEAAKLEAYDKGMRDNAQGILDKIAAHRASGTPLTPDQETRLSAEETRLKQLLAGPPIRPKAIESAPQKTTLVGPTPEQRIAQKLGFSEGDMVAYRREGLVLRGRIKDFPAGGHANVAFQGRQGLDIVPLRFLENEKNSLPSTASVEKEKPSSHSDMQLRMQGFNSEDVRTLRDMSKAMPAEKPLEAHTKDELAAKIIKARYAKSGSSGLAETTGANMLTSLHSKAELVELAKKELGGQTTQAPPPAESAQPTPPAQSTIPPKEGKPGPGAQNETESISQDHLGDITRAIAQQPQASLWHRMQVANNIAATVSAGKDALSTAALKARATGEALWAAYKDPPKWTTFDDALGKLSGARTKSAVDVHAYAKKLKAQIPDKLTRSAIVNYIQADGDMGVLHERASKSSNDLAKGYERAMNLSPEERATAENARSYFNSRLQQLQDADILEHGLENYVNQSWKTDDDVSRGLRSQISSNRLNPNPDFLRKRFYEHYFEGEQAGKVAWDKDIGTAIAVYDRAFHETFASRAAVAQLWSGKASDGRPLLAPGGSIHNLPENPQLVTDTEVHLANPRTRPLVKAVDPETGKIEYHNTTDYKSIPSPALSKWKWAGETADGTPILMKGDVYVHPEIHQKLSNALGTTPDPLSQSALGSALLNVSSKFKSVKFALSAFHQVQEGVHAAGHGVNPFHPPQFDLENNPVHRALVDHGLMLYDMNGQSAFSEGLHGSGLTGGYHDYLFKDYIPRLKMAMGEAAYERNVARYGKELSRDQILRLTAEQANAAFGGLDTVTRHPTWKNAARLIVQAPDFTEARARFVGQALTPYGTEQRVALAKIAGAMWLTSRIVNKVSTGDWHHDTPFGVVIGGREYTLRSIPGDIEHFIDDPRSATMYRENPLLKDMMEFFQKRDAYGNPIEPGSFVSTFAKNRLPISVEEWTKPNRNWVQHLLQPSGVSSFDYQTPATKLARGFAYEHYDKDIAEPERRFEVGRLKSKMEHGKLDDNEVWASYDKGKITQKDVTSILEDTQEGDRMLSYLKTIHPHEALQVWDKMSKEERDKYDMAIFQRVSAASSHAEDYQQQVHDLAKKVGYE